MGDNVNDGDRAPHAAILPSRNPAISRVRGNHGVYRRPGPAHPGTQSEDFLLPERFTGLGRNADPCRAASPPHASGHGKRRLLKSPMPSSAGARPPCLASTACMHRTCGHSQGERGRGRPLQVATLGAGRLISLRTRGVSPHPWRRTVTEWDEAWILDPPLYEVPLRRRHPSRPQVHPVSPATRAG